MLTRALLARAAAILVVAAAGAVVPGLAAAPAGATGCSSSSGVTVLVDYHGLGGGVQSTCVTNGAGRTAAALFKPAGFPLSYAQREPGFVCRVSNKPTTDPCVNASPADAYWSLWWSNGTSGTWTYSSLGVQGLKIPDGGSVAFSWDDVSGDARPGATPRSGSDAPTQEPTEEPPSGTGGSGGGGPGGAGPSEGSSTAPTDTPSGTPTEDGEGSTHDGRRRGDDREHGPDGRDHAGQDGRDGHGRRGAGAPSSDADAEDTVTIGEAGVDPASAEPAAGGLPSWVPPVVVLALLGAGGAATVLRRRRVR